LLFTRSKAGVDSQSIVEVPVDSIAVSSEQPRENFDTAALEGLAKSIRDHGVIQPVVVRKAGNAYQLVAGERRLRAAKLAGLDKVPAVVRDVGPEEMAVLGLVENLEREDLNVIEEARGYRRLIEEFGRTQTEVGRLVGKSQSTVANKLRLLRLPPMVQAYILREGISERHARALLDVAGEEGQIRVLEQIKSRGLSVRETENLVRALSTPPGASEAAAGPRGAGQSGLFDRLGEEAGRGRKGRAPGRLKEVSDRRAIRAFRDLRLFLNTFRRAVDILKEAGIGAEMTQEEGPDYLEVRVVIPLGRTAPTEMGEAGPPGREKAASRQRKDHPVAARPPGRRG